MADDTSTTDTINELANEEHELLQKESDRTATNDDRRRLEAVGIELDRCWDLLRQRRARRQAGLDPEAAEARDESTVEHYQQ